MASKEAEMAWRNRPPGPQEGRGSSLAARGLSLATLVERTGVPASTIHHYRRCGLLRPPVKVTANRFCYDEGHVEALKLIRMLRDKRGLALSEIAEVLPAMQSRCSELGIERAIDPGDDTVREPDGEGGDGRRRVLDAAVHAFRTRSYSEVAVSDIAEAAGMAKGSVYRHFSSKEELFAASIEDQLAETANRFATAVEDLGGPEGLADDPEKAATVFARLVAKAMPILLELGARAAKGDDASQVQARRVLRTLAESAGRPLSEDPVPAGLAVIETAFATVLEWAVGPDWPPRDEAHDLFA